MDGSAGRRLAAPALVGLLTAAGLALRLAVAHQSLFADELSTYWIVTAHDLGGVLSTVHSNAEITPPLYFVAAWLATQISHAPELLRAPSLIAGTATIPLVYLLGMRTLGRAAALVAMALTAVAPFMVYYSAEARGYGVMMALTVLSTLAMLIAVDSGRARWWVVYALASAGAAYSHYTCFFVLAAQLLWVLWAHPEARRRALLANAGAALLFLPWITGLVKDFTSPTGKILSALSPFNAHSIRIVLEHWTLGYPYSTVAKITELPGKPALVLVALGLIVAVVGVARRVRAPLLSDRRLVLLVALFVATPFAEAAVSLVTTHLFAVRNLAASWPPMALLAGALVAAAGPRLRYAAALLLIAGVGIGGVKMLEDTYERPHYREAASFVDRAARPGDAVIDGTGFLSPGPLTAFDAASGRRRLVFRANAPQERDHPFDIRDPIVTPQQAIGRAVAAAAGGRIFDVELYSKEGAPSPDGTFPAGYRLVDTRTYPGIVNVAVQVYAPSG
jgi:4-amino-4-deoxy-L-arabinose transferase-like glycosyltransferase